MPSMLFLECAMYSQYTVSVCSADECVRKKVQLETCGQDLSSLFPSNESVLQGLKIIRNNTVVKDWVRQTLDDCNGDQSRSTRDTLFKV